MHVSQRPNLTKPQNIVLLRQENLKDASREKWSEDVQNTVLHYFLKNVKAKRKKKKNEKKEKKRKSLTQSR